MLEILRQSLLLSSAGTHNCPSRSCCLPPALLSSCHGPIAHRGRSAGAASSPRSKHRQGCSARRKGWQCRAEEEADKSPGNPLFTPEFAKLFENALDREDKRALQGTQKEEEQRLSAQEEVLYALMADSRRTVIQLERLGKLIESSIEREQRQFERLHFCLKKAQGDAAYIRALERGKK